MVSLHFSVGKVKRHHFPHFPPFSPFSHFLRTLYNVEEAGVIVLPIGRKVGNKLVVEGGEFYGHGSAYYAGTGEAHTSLKRQRRKILRWRFRLV